MNLPTILRWCKSNNGTGTLIAVNGTVMKRIFIEDGAIVSAASTNPREYLGQFLIAFGKIDERQLFRAFEIQKKTKMLLGKITVSENMVSQKDLEKILEYKIVETIFDLFLWTKGKFQFHPGAFSKKHLRIQIRLDIDFCLKEGARRMKEWRRFREVFPSDHMVLSLGEKKLPPWEQNPRLKKIFTLLEQGVTVKEMCRELKGPVFHILSRLFGLYNEGYIRVHREKREEEGSHSPGQNIPFGNGLR
jgi:hypothetical protein